MASLLKNGLTEKWRIFQKELYNCQTTIESSHNTKQVKSPKRKTVSRKKSMSPKDLKKKSPSKRSSSKETNHYTRSGRTVKAPTKFWIGAKSDETSSVDVSRSPKKSKKVTETSVEKSKRILEEKAHQKSKKMTIKPVETPKMTNKSIETPKMTSGKKRGVKPDKKKSGTGSQKVKKKQQKKVDESVHSPIKRKNHSNNQSVKRKRVKEAEPVQKKKIKQEKVEKVEVNSSKEVKTSSGNLKAHKTKKITKISVNKKLKSPKKTKGAVRAKKVESFENAETTHEFQDIDLELDDIKVPEVSRNISKPQLSRSQLRIISMETPPLKYFNNNLKLLQSTTPVRSPDWCISQRTESEVKQFQKRREECHRKKTEITYTKTVSKQEMKKMSENKDLKSVLEWVADKNVRSPQWKSRVLQYVIPSRKQMEEEDEIDEEE